MTMLRLIILTFLVAMICAESDIYWREYHKGSIPEDAVPAGYGLYIGQSIHKGSLYPGTIYPKTGEFVLEYYGKVVKTEDIKIMCSRDPLKLKWEYVDVNHLKDSLLDRAVQGGYEGGMRWYIGRTFHENQWKIGKVDFTGLQKSLLIWNDSGALQRIYQFEVLTYV